MGQFKVNLKAELIDVICVPDGDRWYIRFRDQMYAGDEPYTVALSLHDGLGLLALLEQARQQHNLPIYVPENDPIIVPPKDERN